MKLTRIAPLLLIALAPSIPRPIGACSLAPRDGGVWHANPVPGDVRAPTRLTAIFYVERPSESQDVACGASCGPGPAYVLFRLSALDDIVAPDSLGYRFRVVDGHPPPGLDLSQTLFPDPYADGVEIALRFDPDAAPLLFDVEITALDRNGNESEPIVLTIDEDKYR